jgi:hypothetical protein
MELILSLHITFPQVCLGDLVDPRIIGSNLPKVNGFLTNCGRMTRILMFAFQAWKMDNEDPCY